MDLRSANQDQLPTRQGHVIPSVENVLQEMMLAGQTDGLLEEILLQLKTFTQMVWCAAYGNDISVGVTMYSVPMEAFGRIWQQPARPPELDIRMSIFQYEDGKTLNELLREAVYAEPFGAIMSLESGVEMYSADGTGTVKIDLTIPGGNPYGERWHNLILIMFNGTQEMKDKVDYIAGLKIERKTDLEEALYRVCCALSAFYDWAMRTRSHQWYRDPFRAQPRKEPDQISYEPRLGKF